MNLQFHKVTTLPATLQPNAFYFVDNGTIAESYVTDNAGTARTIGNTAMIQSVVNQAIADFDVVQIVADIAARDALALTRNGLVLVLDASADGSVDSGAAMYAFDESGSSWAKVTEYESLDMSLDWANLQNGPASTPAQIDSAVGSSHSHANQTVLNSLTDIGSQLHYLGSPVGGSGGGDWDTVNW